MDSGLRDRIEEALGLRVVGIRPLSGGCIANACHVETASGAFFLKYGSGQVARALEAEVVGLRALSLAAASDGRIRVPDMVCDRAEGRADGQAAGPAFFILEWIEAGVKDSAFWTRLGESLACLHAREPEDGGTLPYGFDSDNYIGATPQLNGRMASWRAFFWSRRIEPQVELAREKGGWRSGWDPLLDRLMGRIDQVVPECDRPSLVHGDLWSGNVMADQNGVPVLIDPAVYHGDGFTDVAMSRLFGGFGSGFYEAYRANAANPPPPSVEEMHTRVYNLYHLINHLNLFGSGYAGAVESSLRQLV